MPESQNSDFFAILDNPIDDEIGADYSKARAGTVLVRTAAIGEIG